MIEKIKPIIGTAIITPEYTDPATEDMGKATSVKIKKDKTKNKFFIESADSFFIKIPLYFHYIKAINMRSIIIFSTVLIKRFYLNRYLFKIKLMNDKSKKISLLMVGNSFSYNTVQHLKDLGNLLNIELEVGVLFIGGCSIDTHYENILKDNHNYEFRYINNIIDKVVFNYSIKEGLEYKNWDYICFQQASHYSGEIDSYSNLIPLMDLIRKDSAAKFIWLNTWSYAKVSPHSEYYRYNHDQKYMYDCIIDVLKKKIINECKFDTIIPSGIVIQLLRGEVGDIYNLVDGFHLNELGCFVSGLTLIRTLLDMHIDPNLLPKIPAIPNVIEKIELGIKELNKIRK